MSLQNSRSEQSRAIVEAMYASAIAGDMTKFASYFADDIVVVEPAFLPYGGRYEGMQAFLRCLGAAFSYMDVSTIKLETLVADGDQVVSFIRVQTAADRSEVQMAEWIEIVDGKVARIRILFHQLGSLISQIK